MSRFLRLLPVLARALLVACLAAVGGTLAFSSPAAAVTCPFWADEQAMISTSPGGCRSTWLVDPGVGQLIGRAQLLQAAGLYGANGFARQWLWYAPMETTSFSNTAQQWVSCEVNAKTGDICAPSQVDYSSNELMDNFAQRPLIMHTFAYDRRYIPRACGNFLRPQNTDIQTNPVPRATIVKFDDRNRDGERQPGEAGLPGWQFRVIRASSQFADQAVGDTAATFSTGADGSAELRFDGLGPGAYRVEEMSRDGWAPTTAPAQTIVVPDGAGDANLGTWRFGNAETRADLVKVAFALTDPPQRIEAGQPTALTVRAQLRNDGPADVSAHDEMDVIVPADCTAVPAHLEVTRPMPAGAVETVDFAVTVTCEDPSFHPMTFADHLSVATPGVEDPDPDDNTVSFEHVFPVFDDADITLSGTRIDCPQRIDVATDFPCVAQAEVRDAGPYAPVTADVRFTLDLPADCTATAVTGSDAQTVVASGDPVTVASMWRVRCAHRSFHPIRAYASAVLNHLHVEDPVDGNASGQADFTVAVFEAADLAVRTLDVRCTEREANTTASACTATAVVANNGPATGVATVTTLTISPEPDCTVASPDSSTSLVLNAGQSATVTATWNLTCTVARRHAVRFAASIRADEPHAEDRAHANDRTTAIWGPADVKPRSLPSSINLDKQGAVPFALLSTATFDAVSQVDRTSLRAGLTGTENSVISCATEPEDVNDDGRPDLVCRSDSTLLGLTCTTTVLRISGVTVDGTRFYAEDTVKVTGCH